MLGLLQGRQLLGCLQHPCAVGKVYAASPKMCCRSLSRVSPTGKLFDPVSHHLSAPAGSLPVAGVSGVISPGQYGFIRGTEAQGHILLQ